MIDIFFSYTKDTISLVICTVPWYIAYPATIVNGLCNLTRGRFCYLHLWMFTLAANHSTPVIELPVSDEQAELTMSNLSWPRRSS
jgi:hypothetical protein